MSTTISTIDLTISEADVFGDTDMATVDRLESLRQLEEAYLAAMLAAYPEAEVSVGRTRDAVPTGRDIVAAYEDGELVERDSADMDTIREVIGRAWDGGAWIVEA